MLVSLVICAVLLSAGCAGLKKLPPCAPVPNGYAVCLEGEPVAWSGKVVTNRSQNYASVADLATTLGVRAEVSADRKHVFVNGKELPHTNGVTDTLEVDGQVYVEIYDMVTAAGHYMAQDFVKKTININLVP